MKARPERVYHYRGLIERSALGTSHGIRTLRYQWREGYSDSTPEGNPLYPWYTRQECRRMAKHRGYKAVFYRDGKREQ